MTWLIDSETGPLPEVDELFPPSVEPIKRSHPDDAASKPAGPIGTGVGFFTPEGGNPGNLFRSFKPDANQLQPFRMPPPPAPRDSLYELLLLLLSFSTKPLI